MADNPVFDPEKVIGAEIGSLSKDELIALCKKLCETACTQCGSDGFRGGFRPGNICRLENGEVTVGPAGKAGENGWTKDELEYMAPEVFWSGIRSSSADVYSIGLILYAGLNGGRPPFIAHNESEPSPDERAGALRTRMNGEKIAEQSGTDEDYREIDVTKELVRFLRNGDNVIAAWAHDYCGRRNVDIGLYVSRRADKVP